MARRLVSLSLQQDISLTVIGGGITKHISNAANAVGSAGGGCNVTKIKDDEGRWVYRVARAGNPNEIHIPMDMCFAVYVNEPDAAVKK